MVDFRKIENSSDPLFAKIYDLYRSSFPKTERRNLGAFEYILNYEKRFDVDALMLNDEFVGFFTYWTFDRFIYVEHFAVDPDVRGQNIGSQTIKTFLAKVELPVVLEVELPEDAQSIRRISFYERLGFKVLSHSYAQPYYDGSGKLLSMLVMSNEYHFADKRFNQIKKTLYQYVYQYSPKENC